MKDRIIRLQITPQTHIRATQGDSIFFRIPRDKLYPSGLKRLKRLERYNQYKEDLRELAQDLGFEIPVQGMSIRFYVPMPKSWKPWQKEVMHLKLHQQKPDIDNFMKAVMDSLRSEDKNIGHIAEMSKHWVNNDTGWIEVTISDPLYACIPFPKTKKSMRL